MSGLSRNGDLPGFSEPSPVEVVEVGSSEFKSALDRFKAEGRRVVALSVIGPAQYRVEVLFARETVKTANEFLRASAESRLAEN